jgi:hypothetical protein
MITGTTFFMIKSGRRTPIEAIPTPDLAVPYAAPKPTFVLVSQVKIGAGKFTSENYGRRASHCTLTLDRHK